MRRCHGSGGSIGLGGLLVDRIAREAGSLGFDALYLWTPSVERFFSRRGWTTIERTTYREVHVAVMSRRIGTVAVAEGGGPGPWSENPPAAD